MAQSPCGKWIIGNFQISLERVYQGHQQLINSPFALLISSKKLEIFRVQLRFRVFFEQQLTSSHATSADARAVCSVGIVAFDRALFEENLGDGEG